MSKRLKNISIPFLLLSFFSLSPVFAADDPPEISGEMIENLLDNVIYRYIFPIAGLICFLFIVKGGYMWMMSSGDPDKIKQAQGTLTWSVIGLVFVIIARLLLSVILDIIE